MMRGEGGRYGVGVLSGREAEGHLDTFSCLHLVHRTMQVKQLHDLITPCKEQLLAKASTLHDANMMNHLSELIRLCSHH